MQEAIKKEMISIIDPKEQKEKNIASNKFRYAVVNNVNTNEIKK